MDFEFFRIYEELFIFVIDSLVYLPPGSRDSYVIKHREAFTPRSFFSQDSFCKLVLILVPNILHVRSYIKQYTKKSTPRCIHHRGVETLRCIHHRRGKTPRCIHHRGVETPRCNHHRGVVLDTGESFYRF
jgi:hypothetical protein